MDAFGVVPAASNTAVIGRLIEPARQCHESALAPLSPALAELQRLTQQLNDNLEALAATQEAIAANPTTEALQNVSLSLSCLLPPRVLTSTSPQPS